MEGGRVRGEMKREGRGRGKNKSTTPTLPLVGFTLNSDVAGTKPVMT